MIKPIGSICNLDCAHCYCLHKKDLLGTSNHFRISGEILEAHIRQYIEGQDRSEVVFSWQGGEPTLLGLYFFRKVVELEQKYKKPNQRIENDLQTNGTLLNDEWGDANLQFLIEEFEGCVLWSRKKQEEEVYEVAWKDKSYFGDGGCTF